MTYTIEQVCNYVEGWLLSQSDKQALTIIQVEAMLNNALVTLSDESDGLGAYVKRQEWYKNSTIVATTILSKYHHIPFTPVEYEKIFKKMRAQIISGVSDEEVIEDLEKYLSIRDVK